jgi:hypothetical protein
VGSDAADVGACAAAESGCAAEFEVEAGRGGGSEDDVGAECSRGAEGDVGGAGRGCGSVGDVGAGCGGGSVGDMGAGCGGGSAAGAARALLAAIADVASARHTSAAWRSRLAVDGVTRSRHRPEVFSRGR